MTNALAAAAKNTRSATARFERPDVMDPRIREDDGNWCHYHCIRRSSQHPSFPPHPSFLRRQESIPCPFVLAEKLQQRRRRHLGQLFRNEVTCRHSLA